VTTRTTPTPCRSARGFTLLEALLALGILTAATIVALEIRMQMVVSGARLRELQRADRDHEALFEMLVSGMLESPVKDEKAGLVWSGTFLDKPYRITRKVILVDNPAVGEVSYDVPSRLPCFEYAIEHGDRTTTAIWYE